MKPQHIRPAVAAALALAAIVLVTAAPPQRAIAIAEPTPAATQAAPRVDPTESAAAQPADAGSARNSPHPAVLAFERPVYPIGVPNPPVGLERY